MITKIINGRIICKDEIITGKSVYIKDDIIFDISDCDLPTDNVIDAKGLYVSAGFIDLHLHGAYSNLPAGPQGRLHARNSSNTRKAFHRSHPNDLHN